jgi:hypothetical protein
MYIFEMPYSAFYILSPKPQRGYKSQIRDYAVPSPESSFKGRVGDHVLWNNQFEGVIVRILIDREQVLVRITKPLSARYTKDWVEDLPTVISVSKDNFSSGKCVIVEK